MTVIFLETKTTTNKGVDRLPYGGYPSIMLFINHGGLDQQ